MANEHVNKVVLGDEVLLDLTADTATAADVAAGKTLHLATGARAVGNASYAGSPTVGGNANSTNSILYGAVDSTSTSTAFTATVNGLDALTDGTTVMLRNGVVTSAAGFTINVNSLGAKPVYNSLATGNPVTPTAPTQDSTIFNINYTMMFTYVEDDVVEGGCWLCFRGYDSNTNTIGYQLRTNSGNMVASDTGYRYRLWLTQADGKKWVPINTSTSTNNTSARTLNTRHIDPFGRIVYRATNGTCNAGAGIGATGIWDLYVLSIGYSYMASGFSLTFPAPVFLRCTPNTDGSATMEVITQTLPSSKDGKIYIHLGTAYSATNMELEPHHPVYWHDGSGIRLWTGAEPSSGPSPSSTTPAMDGTAAVGTSTNYARADHVHPTDTSKVNKTETASTTEVGVIDYDDGFPYMSLTYGSAVGRVGPYVDCAAIEAENSNNRNRASVTAYSDGTGIILNVANTRQGQSVSATLTTADGFTIEKIPTPTGDTMPATKKYVDDGLSGKASMSTATATIATTGWSSNQLTVSVTGVTASNTVIVSPAPASVAEWASCGIYCSAQGSGTLTFTCTTVPSSALTANVLILG